jgi:hypothetical protein
MFATSAERVFVVYGDAAFRALTAEGTAYDRNVNRALFDAEMLTIAWIPTGVELQPLAYAARLSVAALFTNEDFVDSIQRATGDRARIRRRITMVGNALAAAGLPVEMPVLGD